MHLSLAVGLITQEASFPIALVGFPPLSDRTGVAITESLSAVGASGLDCFCAPEGKGWLGFIMLGLPSLFSGPGPVDHGAIMPIPLFRGNLGHNESMSKYAKRRLPSH